MKTFSLLALVEGKVESQLAVLAPVRGLGARTGLDDVFGEGDFHQGLGSVDLDISTTRSTKLTTSPQVRHHGY